MLERPIRCQDCSHSHPWVGVGLTAEVDALYAEQIDGDEHFHAKSLRLVLTSITLSSL